MEIYKNSNEYSPCHQIIDESISDETSQLISSYHDMYQAILQINPTANPKEFCLHLDELSNRKEIKEKSFASNYQLHDLDFFKIIVSYIKIDDVNIILSVLHFLNIISDYKGPIQASLLDTDLIEVCLQLFPMDPRFTSVVLDILSSLVSANKLYFDSQQNPNEGMDRIFGTVSLESIHEIVLRHQNRNQVVNNSFDNFIYQITEFPINQEMQACILSYISEKYNSQEESQYPYLIHILYNMSKYNNNFAIDVFFENDLHKFLIDMLYLDKDKLLYRGLATFIKLFEINIDPEYNFPKINSNFEERILSIAFEVDNMENKNDKKYKESIRLLAFRALTYMMTENPCFQRCEGSSIQYLSDVLYKGDCFPHLVEIYFDSTTKIKLEIVQFLTQFIISGSKIEDTSIFIEYLIKNGIISIFGDIFEMKDQVSINESMCAFRALFEECDKYGLLGIFELSIIEILSLNQILEILDDTTIEKEVRERVAIFHSNLLSLPNKSYEEYE